MAFFMSNERSFSLFVRRTYVEGLVVLEVVNPTTKGKRVAPEYLLKSSGPEGLRLANRFSIQGKFLKTKRNEEDQKKKFEYNSDFLEIQGKAVPANRNSSLLSRDTEPLYGVRLFTKQEMELVAKCAAEWEVLKKKIEENKRQNKDCIQICLNGARTLTVAKDNWVAAIEEIVEYQKMFEKVEDTASVLRLDQEKSKILAKFDPKHIPSQGTLALSA